MSEQQSTNDESGKPFPRPRLLQRRMMRRKKHPNDGKDRSRVEKVIPDDRLKYFVDPRHPVVTPVADGNESKDLEKIFGRIHILQTHEFGIHGNYVEGWPERVRRKIEGYTDSKAAASVKTHSELSQSEDEDSSEFSSDDSDDESSESEEDGKGQDKKKLPLGMSRQIVGVASEGTDWRIAKFGQLCNVARTKDVVGSYHLPSADLKCRDLIEMASHVKSTSALAQMNMHLQMDRLYMNLPDEEKHKQHQLSGRKTKAFFRYTNVEAPKFYPEGTVSTALDLIYPAAALVPIYGAPDKRTRAGEQPRRNKEEEKVKIRDANFARFFVPGHHQRCDVCYGPLRYESTEGEPREFLLMYTCRVVPSEFANLIFGELFDCPCKELYLCVQTLEDELGCMSVFKKARRELIEHFQEIIEERRKTGRYPETEEKWFKTDGTELTEEERKLWKKVDKTKEEFMKLENNCEKKRVVKLGGDELAILDHFKEMSTKGRRKKGPMRENDHGRILLDYCRRFIGERMFSEENRADSINQANWAAMKGEFMNDHNCAECDACACEKFAEWNKKMKGMKEKIQMNKKKLEQKEDRKKQWKEQLQAE